MCLHAICLCKYSDLCVWMSARVTVSARVSVGLTIPSGCSDQRSFQLISVKQEQEGRWDRAHQSENRGETEVWVGVIFILSCYIFSRVSIGQRKSGALYLV